MPLNKNFGSQPRSIVTSFTCKDIITDWIRMEIVEFFSFDFTYVGCVKQCENVTAV